MKITAQYIVILTLSRVVMSFECIRDVSFLNYDEISVMKGIKLRKHNESLYNISDTQLELNAKTMKSKSITNEVTLHSLMNDFLSNHVLEFNLSTLFQEEAEVPRRRRHHNAFQMVLMGIVIFLMFFVTLGFQFLATFGGKAFLMAKLALLLASINGLKRVASSGVHYGLYHQSDPTLYAYDRFDRPRTLLYAEIFNLFM